jgi:S-adenosylmethionine decarboxylase
MHGLHCTADLTGCNLQRLIAHDELMSFVLNAIKASELQVVGHQSYVFPNHTCQFKLTTHGGITLTVLLAESHVCIHTWPELLAVTLDVYVCNFVCDNSVKAQQLLKSCIDWFEPTHCQTHTLTRGWFETIE